MDDFKENLVTTPRPLKPQQVSKFPTATNRQALSSTPRSTSNLTTTPNRISDTQIPSTTPSSHQHPRSLLSATVQMPHSSASTESLRKMVQQLQVELTNSQEDVRQYQEEYLKIRNEGSQLFDAYQLKCNRLTETTKLYDPPSLCLSHFHEKTLTLET